jgi:DNA-binding response OmpR family regulator
VDYLGVSNQLSRVLTVDLSATDFDVVRRSPIVTQEITAEGVEKTFPERDVVAVLVGASARKEETLELCARLQAQRNDLPLLVVLDRWAAPRVQHILELGNTKCLIRPIAAETLLRVAGELSGTRFDDAKEE